MRLLATKLISLAFKERLLQQGFSVIDTPFISVNPLPFDWQNKSENLIFTSQNAVCFFLQKHKNDPKLASKKCFCVGEKTKLLLEENGQKVIKMTQKSSELAHFLIKNYKNERFTFFCGTRRMPDLEVQCQQHQIPLHIVELYETYARPQKLKTTVDGILFYSPSAVTSFFMENEWPQKAYGFCLGTSTAAQLKEHTEQYYVAQQPNETALLLTLKKHFCKHA